MSSAQTISALMYLGRGQGVQTKISAVAAYWLHIASAGPGFPAAQYLLWLMYGTKDQGRGAGRSCSPKRAEPRSLATCRAETEKALAGLLRRGRLEMSEAHSRSPRLGVIEWRPEP